MQLRGLLLNVTTYSAAISACEKGQLILTGADGVGGPDNRYYGGPDSRFYAGQPLLWRAGRVVRQRISSSSLLFARALCWLPWSARSAGHAWQVSGRF